MKNILFLEKNYGFFRYYIILKRFFVRLIGNKKNLIFISVTKYYDLIEIDLRLNLWIN